MFDLRDAVVRGDVEAVKRFERHGVDWRDLTAYDDGYSAVHRAARNGRLEMVEYLVDNGADLVATNASRETPLELAVEQEHADVVAYLAERTLAPDALARYGDVRILEPAFLRRLSEMHSALSLPSEVAYVVLTAAGDRDGTPSPHPAHRGCAHRARTRTSPIPTSHPPPSTTKHT